MRAMLVENSSEARRLSNGGSQKAKGKSASRGAVFCAGLLSLLAFGFGLPAGAQIQLPERGHKISAPPVPKSVKITVHRGESVDIPLTIYGSAGDQTRFRIKTKPEQGTLSEPKITDRDSGEVTYRHSGKAAPLQDRFTFVAQTNAGVSPPA